MSTSLVKHFLWADYSRSSVNQYQLLMSDYVAGILTNAIAVMITSTSKPFFNLAKGPLIWLSVKLSSSWNSPAPLQQARDFYELGENVIEGRFRGFVTINLNPPTAPNRPKRAVEFIRVLGIAILAFCAPPALLIASILSAGLATDRIALSNSPSCGRYVYSPNISTSSGPFLEYEHRAEAQSGLYASDCYGSSPLVDICNKFYNQSISYVAENCTCPFQGPVCDGFGNSSIRLSTGLVLSSALGINSNTDLFFSKTMTCSPLIKKNGLIRKGTSDNGEDQWEYWYGSSLANYTWANPVKESAWEIKGYSTGIHCSDPDSTDSSFIPLPDFTAQSYPVTIIFISSHSIFHQEARDDPIFPALHQAQLPPEYHGPKLYYNNSTQAGVLGCVDKYQVCKTKSGPCWDNSNITSILVQEPNKRVSEEQLVARFLLLALDYSTSCGSIQFRGAEALDAQTKIAHMQSLPLAKEQWKAEAEKMFQTSLARIQLNVYDIARGTAANFAGYKDVMSDEYRGVCHMVKIPTVGWKNVNFWGLFGTIFTVALIWVLGSRKQDPQGTEVLLLVIFWQKCMIPAWQFLLPQFKLLFRHIGDYIEQVVASCC